MWVPFIAWGLARAESQRRAGGGPLTLLLAGLALGVALWQCLEYAVHRFVFHKEPCSAWGVTVCAVTARMHGCFVEDHGAVEGHSCGVPKSAFP